MNADVETHYAKKRLSLCIIIIYVWRVTYDCASILDSIAKKTSCYHCFSHGASLYQQSFSRMNFTLSLFHVFRYSAYNYVRGCACANLTRCAYALPSYPSMHRVYKFSSRP